MVAEHVRRAPQQLNARSLLLFLQDFDDGVKVLVGFRQAIAFRSDVAIVERVVRSAEFFHEFESNASSVLCILYRVGAIFPRTLHRSRTERIASRSPECVPVHNAESHVLFHRLAFDNFVFVVPVESKRVFRFGTFVLDL